MKNLISVVIPTSCRPITLLDQAVQSVLTQSLSVYEIIIVDDNKDNILSEELASYCCKNNLVYIASNKVGAAAARNIGISIAKGNYVAFLDDDDIWLPNKLQLQMKLFSEDNVGLVYSRGYTIKKTIDNISQIPYATDSYYKTEVTYLDLLEKNYIGTTTQLVIKKSALIHINGFDEALPSRQDYDLCLRIACDFRCLGVNEYLFIHYIHDKGQITANAYINMKGYQLLFKKFKTDIYRVNDAPRKWCYRITRYTLASSSYAVFMKYLLVAIAYKPKKMIETIKKCFNYK